MAQFETDHPIFKLYPLEVLADRLDYSLEVLVAVKRGNRPASKTFRRLAIAVFQRPEAELFLPAEPVAHA